MIADIKALDKEVDHLKTKLATEKTDASGETVKSINGVRTMAQKVSVDTPAALRNLADQFKDRIKSGIVVLGSTVGTKVMLIVVVTKDLIDRYHAGNIITPVAAVVGGRGGGRPDMAQAGGNQPLKLDQALETAYEVVEQMTIDDR
jgi:alanyl-tRNA synthetase